MVGGCVGVELLDRLGAPVACFWADGAYDTRAVYGALDKVCAEQIDLAIPPRRTASSSRSGGGTWRHREAMIGVNILNRMTELGMPESVAVRA